MDFLAELNQRHPGIEDYAMCIAGYFGIFYKEFRPLFLAQLDPDDSLDAACQEWERLKILPRCDVRTDEQVGAIWQSPLFQAMLRALQFYPPSDADVRPYLPPPVQKLEDVGPRMTLPNFTQEAYWKFALQRTFPDVFLFPFMEGLERPRGCDLACGWGRASLALGDPPGYEIHGADLTQVNLDRLQSLAEKNGFKSIRAVRADVTALPYPDDHFDFFLAFDIFEHLTDPTLDRVIAEVLRCARQGGVLYTEIPLKSYCPMITHLQNFSADDIVERFRLKAHGKTMKLIRYSRHMEDHFAFRVMPAV